MNIPGSAPLGGLIGGSVGGQPALNAQQAQEQQMVRFMSAAMESCPAKTVLAGTMGFALGGAFGLFMSSMRYDTPLSTGVNGAASITSLPMRDQIRLGLKDMGRASFSSAKNFGKVGAIFSGTECCIEGLRGRNEISNGVAAGCLTGAALAHKAGPQAAAVGCLGFAAFSAAIDTYMRQPSEPATGGPII